MTNQKRPRKKRKTKWYVVLILLLVGVSWFITTQTAIAALRYRLKYQQVPETLTLLVPEFMSDVPPDPFDGEPIRYVKQSNGFIVYSVGQDGQDNGGRDRDSKDRNKPFDLVCSVQGLE